MDLKSFKIEVENKVKQVKNLAELDKIFKEYKKEITCVFNSLKDQKQDQRKQLGKDANIVKKHVEDLFEQVRKELKTKEINAKISSDRIDITEPVEKIELGHLHPLTIVTRDVCDIFKSMGFSVLDGPEIEDEWYNFDALNIPKNHPARDLWDTFWLKNGKLLRTHTSPMQIRHMKHNPPPLRVIVPGKVFRHEATDASHEVQFYQVEGLMIDKHISAANFKAIIEEFLKRFFKGDIEIRLRPSFFPFTEPSFEIDLRRGGDWIEIMGAGMVHPNVFKSAGVSGKWQGFAFGVGLDRLAMLRYGIDDIRLFYNGDLRFINQF